MNMLCMLFLSMAPVSDDWSVYLGPNRNGSAVGNGIFEKERFGLETAWKIQLGSGYSQVVADSKTLYTLFSDGTNDLVAAISTENGKELWRTVIAETYKGHDGSEDGPMATPVISGDALYGLGPWGHLFKVSLSDGKMLWKKDLRETVGAVKPEYGFASSPLLVNDLIVMSVGGKGLTLAAFHQKDGTKAWSLGDDPIEYQSPALLELAGEKQIVFAGNEILRGVDPKTGAELWQHKYPKPDVASCSHIISATNNRFLVDQTRLARYFEVVKENGNYVVNQLWESADIKGAYPNPVYHNNHFYGFNRNTLVCLNDRGERLWRSRPPGKGALMLVDNHVVAWSIDGRLVAIEATPDGYKQVASVKVTEVGSITPPIFVNGRFFVRTITELAAIKVTDRSVSLARKDAGPDVSKTRFAKRMAEIAKAGDKSAAVAAFLAGHKQMPIIEDDWVHFVYNGEARDVGIFLGAVSRRGSDPMERVSGTNLWHRSYKVRMNARYEYAFQVDFDKVEPDAANPNHPPGAENMSDLTMPGWKDPAWLTAGGELPALKEETFITKDLEEGERKLHVFLPPGYSKNNDPYPLILVLNGEPFRKNGNMVAALQQLMPKTVEPAVVVFMDQPGSRMWWEFCSGGQKEFSDVVTGQLLPFLGERYHLDNRPERRMVMGADLGGHGALYLGLARPDFFGKVSVHSFYAHNSPMTRATLAARMKGKEKAKFYIDWCEQDVYDPGEGTDLARDGKVVGDTLREDGYDVTAIELKTGRGWGSWRAQTSTILESMLPARH